MTECNVGSVPTTGTSAGVHRGEARHLSTDRFLDAWTRLTSTQTTGILGWTNTLDEMCLAFRVFYINQVFLTV